MNRSSRFAIGVRLPPREPNAMDRQLPPTTGPEKRPDDPTARTSDDPAIPARLDHDQLDRWAQLIADGRGEFPTGLAPLHHGHLLAAVRQRLRDRMVRHIARAIAARLRDDAGPRSENDPHA
jgi:hypothetical protein